MRSVTIEYQRYGDSTGILRSSDRYLRTIGLSGAADEVPPPLDQARLERALGALDYQNFSGPVDVAAVQGRAEDVIEQLKQHLRGFLPDQAPEGHQPGSPYQIDVVARARELAQLPLEALEADTDDAVITRRVRQPWTGPEIVSSARPKILFAWSAAGGEVPASRHLGHLEDLLRDWGGADEPALVTLEEATLDQLRSHLSGDHGYTHVHVLAHGIGPPPVDAEALLDIDAQPGPSVYLALTDQSGGVHRCTPDELAAVFAASRRRPATMTLATCHSAEVKPIHSGGSFAHALHEVGVPVVVASQLALTKVGSETLITEFLAEVLDGGDPRLALRRTRAALRATKTATFYDHLAIVGYVHLDQDFDEQLKERSFQVAFDRLRAASEHAAQLAATVGTGSGTLSTSDVCRRFSDVRDRLERLVQSGLTKKQREELHGLQASSFKREARAAWGFSTLVSGVEADDWRRRSREVLAEAHAAYRRAADVSLDHHWAWVQWLALELVINGPSDLHHADWIVAERAARLDLTDNPIWALGSLAELRLLATQFTPAGSTDWIGLAQQTLDDMVDHCRQRHDTRAVPPTLQQLERYRTWWGVDDTYRLPPEVVTAAARLHDHLVRRWAG
jgi:hypothetical protein